MNRDKTCEGCGRTDIPLRNIKMKSGSRELLCESCFIEELAEERVDPSDPRVENHSSV